MTKVCNKCGQIKKAGLFYCSPITADGLQGHCKECHKAYFKNYRQEKEEEEKERQRAYRERNKERRKRYQKAYRLRQKEMMKNIRVGDALGFFGEGHKFFLLQCYHCAPKGAKVGTENYGPAVATGQCAWCGYSPTEDNG